jgi:hypothetical protein
LSTIYFRKNQYLLGTSSTCMYAKSKQSPNNHTTS